MVGRSGVASRAKANLAMISLLNPVHQWRGLADSRRSLQMRAARAQPNRGRSKRSSYFQPSCITPPEWLNRDKGLDDIRINPLLVQRTVPQSTAEQGRISALRICVHLCPSVVLFCPGPAISHGNCGLGSASRPSQNNCQPSPL